MKIFLCGAQGTGKSALVNSFPIEKYSLKEYDSFSKKFIKPGEEKIQIQTNKGGFLKMQIGLFTHCANIYINEDNFISSRSFIDTLAYVDCDSKYKEELENIKKMTFTYIEYLSRQEDIFYFYFPIEFEISGENNSIRITDKDYQRRIDNKIKYFLDSSRVEYKTLSGSMENRLQAIEETISGK